MTDNSHKTNLKLNIHVTTEDVNKEEDIIADFYVNIEELNELVIFIRKNNLNPHSIKLTDIEDTENNPTIINQLYASAYETAFKKHLKHLMWTERDFFDEAKFLMNTEDLDADYAHYDFNTSNCDSDEEYYDKIRTNEGIMNAYQNRYERSINILKRSITANDMIEFNGILCELI